MTDIDKLSLFARSWFMAYRAFLYCVDGGDDRYRPMLELTQRLSSDVDVREGFLAEKLYDDLQISTVWGRPEGEGDLRLRVCKRQGDAVELVYASSNTTSGVIERRRCTDADVFDNVMELLGRLRVESVGRKNDFGK